MSKQKYFQKNSVLKFNILSLTDRSVKKMSPRTKKQFEEIRQEKRELIIETALEVFATYGYHGTSISMIAQHAGIAKGLLYIYFKSKEELLKAIVNEGIEKSVKLFEPILSKDFKEDELTTELFSNLFKQFFKILKENTPFWQFYYALTFQPHVAEIIFREYEYMVNPYLDVLSKYYKRHGSKNPQADALHAHVLLDGIINNLIQPHDEFKVDEMVRLLTKRLEKPIY